jgi:hypothetical protein
MAQRMSATDTPHSRPDLPVSNVTINHGTSDKRGLTLRFIRPARSNITRRFYWRTRPSLSHFFLQFLLGLFSDGLDRGATLPGFVTIINDAP